MKPGILAAVVAAAVVVLVGLGLGAFALLAPPSGQPACQSRFGTECSDIPLDQLERAFDVDLPEGTVVLSSEYTQFQDWRLTATFELPDDTFALPDGWADAEPGVVRTAEREGTTLTLTASTS